MYGRILYPVSWMLIGADYLLRDSLHLGIRYGIYDKDRLINTMSIATDQETCGTSLVVEEGGWHVAESLVIARYQMFAQVYFHKTRRAYDHHIENALKEILSKHGEKTGFFPLPDSIDNLKKYIDYDDWKMYGLLKEGLGVSMEKSYWKEHMINVYIKQVKFQMNLNLINLKMFVMLLKVKSVLMILQKNLGIKQERGYTNTL